ncbi:UPF0606 protein KIAA1549L homolog isoform X1 [Pleurodeles waltl]|uniref:UPF0606 protein KIAA1549L homolog isoform X1 n=1 Tax=Pleurodeles waltl TaxID=8319 RepID=UPI003709C204
MARREAGLGAAHLRALPAAWSGVCGQRTAVTGGASHLLLGIGLLLLLLRGLEAESTTEDNTQSTLDSSTSLWVSVVPQLSSTSSGPLTTAVQLSWNTDLETSRQTAVDINSSSIDSYTDSPASTRDAKTNVTQVDIPSGFPILSTSQAAKEPTDVSGLTSASMTIQHPITTSPAVTYSSAAMPSWSSLFDTFPISEGALSASGSASPVFSSASPSSSSSPSLQPLPSSPFFSTRTFSSSVTVSLNDITLTQSDTLTPEVPSLTHSESSLASLGISVNMLNSYSTDNVNPDMSQYFTSSTPESASHSTTMSTVNYESESLSSSPSTSGSTSYLSSSSLLNSASTYTPHPITNQDITTNGTKLLHEANVTVLSSSESETLAAHIMSLASTESTAIPHIDNSNPTKVMFSSTFESTSTLPDSSSTNSVYILPSFTTINEKSSVINSIYTTDGSGETTTQSIEGSGESRTHMPEGPGESSTQTTEGSGESSAQTTEVPQVFSAETTMARADTTLPKTDHNSKYSTDSILTMQSTVNEERSGVSLMQTTEGLGDISTQAAESSGVSTTQTTDVPWILSKETTKTRVNSALPKTDHTYNFFTDSVLTMQSKVNEESLGVSSMQTTEGLGDISFPTAESSGVSTTQTTDVPWILSKETTKTRLDTALPKTDHTYNLFTDSILTMQSTVYEESSGVSSMQTTEGLGDISTQTAESSGVSTTQTTDVPWILSKETTKTRVDTALPKTDHTFNFFTDSVLTTQSTINDKQLSTNTMVSTSSESESLSTNFISTAPFESISSFSSDSISNSHSTNSAYTTPSIATSTEGRSGESSAKSTEGLGESSTQTTEVPTAFSEAVTVTRVHTTTNSTEPTLPITEGAFRYSSVDYTSVPAGQATTQTISSNTEITETKSSAPSNTYVNVSEYATTSFVFTTDYELSLNSQENLKSSGTSLTIRPTEQTSVTTGLSGSSSLPNSNPSLPSSTSHISQEGITNEITVITVTESTNTVSLTPTIYSSPNLQTSQFPTDEIISSNTEIHGMTTSGQPLHSQTTASFISNNEMSDTHQTVYSHLTSNMFKRSTWGTAPTSEDLTPSINVKTGSTNRFLPGTESYSSTRHTDLITLDTTGIVNSNNTSSFIAATTGPSLVSTVFPMQTYSATYPPTLTHSLPSSTQHTSSVLSTNLTSSVITVPPSPVPHDTSTEVSSDVSAATHISVPDSSVPNLNTTFARGKTTQAVTALTHSTLTPLSHVQSTSYLTSDSKAISTIRTPVTSDVHVTSAPVNMSTSTSSSTSHLFTMTNKITTPTSVHSTTHSSTLTTLLPVVPENPTLSEVTKTSTAHQRTISAALTSITASAKATTLPAATVTNTTAVATNTTTMSTLLRTTPSSQKCVLSENIMVNTVLVVAPKLMTVNVNMMNNISNGLSEALGNALKNTVQVQINTTSLDSSGADLSTITIGYFVKIILKNVIKFYIPSAVTDSVTKYGNSSFTGDIKHHVPSLLYVPVLASPRIPPPGVWFQLETVLLAVGSLEDVHSCSFVQTMEQNLLNAFQAALTKNTAATSNVKTVQIVGTSLQANILTLTYAASNSTGLMNGTVSSRLLNLLSAEEIWLYLGYPPKTIAEALKYPVLSTEDSTRPYWVYTVIQGVNDTLLKSTSFARLMEQRLGQLFEMSQQQARRFKRATEVGAYTVQMVSIQRLQGPKNLAELKYYALKNGEPLLGSTASKQLSTIDSQTMALTLGYVVQVQAESVENEPPSNMWIIAAVLAPIAVVTVIIIIIAAVLCRKSKSDFKADSLANMPPRPKPVQGFDYAKQHLGQQGAEDEALPVTQETVVPPLTVSQERNYPLEGSTEKTARSTGTRKSQSPSENGSFMSNESGQPSSGKSTPQKVMAQQKVTKEETRRRNGFKTSKKIAPLSDEDDGCVLYENSSQMPPDPFDTSSGSVQLISIKSVGVPPSQPASDRSQESAVINGEVNKALKQKSDIEHYRNKLRLKAKKKGYYDFPPIDGSKSLTERKRKMYEKKQKEIDSVLDPDTDVSSPTAEPKNRQPPTKSVVYRSRQSLNSPSPGETEMDLLVTRERPRRGIRNSGYDTEPEVIEETNVDRVKESRRYAKSRQMKGHSETSTLSSQPSIDEVRQQMHMLLEEAFSLASAGHAAPKRQQEPYTSAQQLPYSEVVTSAPGTMTRPRGAVQWVPTYGPETYQYSLPKPAYRFTQLPEMVMGSPPPPVPPRTGPVAVPSLRRSTSDMGSSKTRLPESEPKHDTVAYAPVLRNPATMPTVDQTASNYSGDTVPAVFAIPANRSGFTGYFVPRPPSSYRNQAWVSYTGESELPGQWADSVPLPGYIEAYPRPHYPQSSPSRLPRQYNQPTNMHPGLEQAAVLSAAASQQSLADTDTPDTSLTNLSTAALVKAIREEVAKLAKKQTDRFEFQV